MVQEGYAQDGAYQPPQQYPADAYAPQYGAPQQVHYQLCAFRFVGRT